MYKLLLNIKKITFCINFIYKTITKRGVKCQKISHILEEIKTT
jgi:hypothetical protein